MKGKGARLFKKIISMVNCVSRAKCMAIRSKTDDMRARLVVTALTVLSKREKFSIAAISGKINDAIDGIFNHIGTSKDHSCADEDMSDAIVLYSKKAAGGDGTTSMSCVDEAEGGNHELLDLDDDDNKYPDLRHSLFDEEEQELADLLEDPNSSMSVIDIVKNSKENGESFNLEDEIDQVADLFITKFHKRIRLQKLLSFKRYQQMMERSA